MPQPTERSCHLRHRSLRSRERARLNRSSKPSWQGRVMTTTALPLPATGPRGAFGGSSASSPRRSPSRWCGAPSSPASWPRRSGGARRAGPRARGRSPSPSPPAPCSGRRSRWRWRRHWPATSQPAPVSRPCSPRSSPAPAAVSSSSMRCSSAGGPGFLVGFPRRDLDRRVRLHHGLGGLRSARLGAALAAAARAAGAFPRRALVRPPPARLRRPARSAKPARTLSSPARMPSR